MKKLQPGAPVSWSTPETPSGHQRYIDRKKGNKFVENHQILQGQGHQNHAQLRGTTKSYSGTGKINIQNDKCGHFGISKMLSWFNITSTIMTCRFNQIHIMIQIHNRMQPLSCWTLSLWPWQDLSLMKLTIKFSVIWDSPFFDFEVQEISNTAWPDFMFLIPNYIIFLWFEIIKYILNVLVCKHTRSWKGRLWNRYAMLC